jgi:acyl-[acyl-carrier-protein]-phospholipid O-acyltransferase/long-chain-fatty-acid--[acyl-carrier-protein] ligase
MALPAAKVQPVGEGGDHRFAAMVGSYSLGIFNDNYFKQAVMLLAVAAGREAFQGYAGVLFTLPWLLFAAHAGWLADRFSKRAVVVAAKVLELLAMLFGAAGILLGSWPLIFVMVFTMALQSTIFSPALNGAIPELYPAEAVIGVNSRIRAISTSAILVGIILAGFSLEVGGTLGGVAAGRWIVAAAVVTVAAGGVLASLGVPRRPPADISARFPLAGPLLTLAELRRCTRDGLLTLTLFADAVVWFIAVAQMLVINVLGLAVLELGFRRTSYLQVAELGGVAIGGALAGRLARGGRWHRVIVPGFVALAIPLLAMTQVPTFAEPASRAWAAAGLLLAAGIPGGLLLIPLESFFQVRPEPRRRGAVIAAANFTAFVAMALASLAANGLNAWLDPYRAFAALGGLSLLTAAGMWLWLRRVDTA